MPPILRAILRLAAVSTLLPPVLLALEDGSAGQAALFAGFLGAAVAGLVRQSMGSPFGGFETFLLSALALASSVAVLAWSLVAREGDRVLRDGQLCPEAWPRIEVAVAAFLGGGLLALLLVGVALVLAQGRIRAASAARRAPPLNLWLVLGMVLALGLMATVSVLMLNRASCSATFLPVGLMLPMLTVFTGLLATGYCVSAWAIRTR